MAIYRCTINGVEVSANLKSVELDPGGDGVNGTGRLYFDQQAGGMDIRNMHEVRVWQPYDDVTGLGIAQGGRLFGGHVNMRDTGNAGTTKLWRLTCWDYNVILTKVVRDVLPVKQITLTAGTFLAQIQSLFNIIQFNGGAGPPNGIDTTTGIGLSYASMPAVTYEGGHNVAWYVKRFCATLQGFLPAVRPHFYMGLGTTFGS